MGATCYHGRVQEFFNDDFLIRWVVDDYRVSFQVWLSSGREGLSDGTLGPPLFGEEMSEDPETTDTYAAGVIKWDACSEVTFDDHLHLCGRHCWMSHLALMAHLWRRAFELMKSPMEDKDKAPLTLP